MGIHPTLDKKVAFIVSFIKFGTAKSGVTKSLPGGEVYAGFPARKIREHNKREALINKINTIEKNLKRVQSKK